MSSAKIIPHATDTFNEPIFPFIGIFNVLSHRFRIDLEIPFPSEPITIAVFLLNLKSKIDELLFSSAPADETKEKEDAWLVLQALAIFKRIS